MASLYELNDQYIDVLSQFDFVENQDEAQKLWDALDAIDSDIEKKADAYARIMRNKQAEAEACKTEILRLQAKQKSAENAAERMKNAIAYTLKTTGKTSMDTSIGRWYFQRNPPRCDVIDEKKVPVEFRIPQPDKIDKSAILKHFKTTGEIIDGTDVTSGESLRFR